MRTLAIIAIIVGAIALAGAAFAYGPGMGGGWGGYMMGPGYHMDGTWGGHMMAPGYHMNGVWGGHMGQAWGPQNANGYYGPGYGWCYANPNAMRGWGAPAAPETVPSLEE
jgi:hypothetical protein